MRGTSRRWIGPLLAVLLLVSMWPDRGARAAGGGHLYLVFAPGLCGWQGSDPYCHDPVPAAQRARATFSGLRSALAQAGIKYRGAYYSYNPENIDSYSVNETHQRIATSVAALDSLLRALMTRDAHARFDLLGYSLGGLVMASWEATDGLGRSADIMKRVRSVVTFDSPVRGSTALARIPLASAFFGGAVWGDLRPGSGTIRAITSHTNSWWRSAGRMHSVANSADRIVPPRDALLGRERTVHDARCPADILFFHSCHGAVLNDTADNRWVACHWVVSGSPCAATPTPTPSPSPTSTPTPSPAPTVTPTLSTPLPTNTAVGG